MRSVGEREMTRGVQEGREAPRLERLPVTYVCRQSRGVCAIIGIPHVRNKWWNMP